MIEIKKSVSIGNKNNVIPPITSPSGRHWNQPMTSAILIDDTHALMASETFKALADYSSTKPGGVYHGKMWRRHDGLYDPSCAIEDRKWLLCWYGPHVNPDLCTVNYREILIADEVGK